VDAGRGLSGSGPSGVFTVGNVESLGSHSSKSWCDTWLEAKAIEAEYSTHDRYKRIVERFTEFLGAKANRDLSTLQASDIARFRDHEAKDRATATANLALRVLRVCLGEAVRGGLLTRNPGTRAG